MTDSVTESPTGAHSPPSDYGLIVPEGWFRIPLDPGEWKRPIRALVERTFDGQDDAAIIRRELARSLRAHAEEGYENGGLELYISTMSIGPLPLSTSLLVTVVPTGQDLGLAVKGGRQREVDEILLPHAGSAVRRRSRSVPDADDTSGNELPITVVDYVVRIPGTQAFLLLTFSTSLDPFVDAMVELFEAVAKSLHWR
ncbi:hypothetical protein [Streptomyces sp. NPDC054794]